MSWLKQLNRAYRDSVYRIRNRRIILRESPNCEIKLDSLDADALVLDFEGLVDRRTKGTGESPIRKCDLLAVYGSDASCHILMIEVKGSGRTRPRRVRAAAVQLRNSKRIIEGAMKECSIRLPDNLTWEASIVVSNPSQSRAARNEMSMTNAEFRRVTGIPVRLVLCGGDAARQHGDADQGAFERDSD